MSAQDTPTQLGLGIIPAPPGLTDTPERIGTANMDYADARDILTRASGFIEDYDHSLNPYGGCAFGCRYCYAASFARTPELRDTWGQWVSVKRNAAELLGRRARGTLDGKRIYMSSVTDPYQPVERKLRLTRAILEILAERHAPKLVVQTRSPDVVRDIDIFRRIEREGGRVQVNMTITTDDEEIRRAFEPGCPANPVRMSALRELSEAGIQTAATMTPLLLVQEPQAFAERLIETGSRSFVIQPFHPARKTQFIAGTRREALDTLVERLDCDSSDAPRRYRARYTETRRILRQRLPNLAEGKEGFSPPF